MSYTARYDKGDWKALCDVCGRLFKSTLLRKRWDGLMCCYEDWEIRQPQDFVKGQADHMTAPWIRDEPSDQFVYFCDIYNSTGYCGTGVAGCCVPGNLGVMGQFPQQPD